jgi:hypothetical protein
MLKKAKEKGVMTEEEFAEAKKAMLKNLAGPPVVYQSKRGGDSSDSESEEDSLDSESEEDSSDSGSEEDSSDSEPEEEFDISASASNVGENSPDKDSDFEAVNNAVAEKLRESFARANANPNKAKRAKAKRTKLVANKAKAKTDLRRRLSVNQAAMLHARNANKRPSSGSNLGNSTKKKKKKANPTKKTEHSLLLHPNTFPLDLPGWKSKYVETFGKRPAGRMANDVGWLKKKIYESKSDIMREMER